MRKNFASRAFGPTCLLLLLGSSCSLVYDLSPDQCGSNADCESHFGQGFTCDAGICICRDASCSGTSGSGGSSANGGSGASGGFSGTDGEGGMPGVTGGSSGAGGSSAGGGTSGKGGSGGKGATGGTVGTDAGAGGMDTGPECATNSDCYALFRDDDWVTNPRVCVQPAGTCVPLMTPDCPFVLPLELAEDDEWKMVRSGNPIIVGGFAPADTTSLDTIGRNYDLALSELALETDGVYAGSTVRRRVMMVVCNFFYASQDQLDAPARHLMEELKVPGVVSTLLLQDQAYVWENIARDNGVFMIQTLYSDQGLISARDDGLVWHMLSGADSLSVSYQPLLDRTLSHLRAIGSLGAAEEVKVAHIRATDEPFLQDTANYLEANLQFNGQSVEVNEDAGLFESIPVISDYSDKDDSEQTNAAAVNSILAFAPHVVIGTTVSELFKRIIPAVESSWDALHPSQGRPFYLVGALGYNDPEMPGLINGASGGQRPLYQRILGVNWPAASDPTIYEEYQERYQEAYGARQDGYENFYDATYYLLYGLAAAAAPLDGTKITLGLQRVTARGTNAQVTVGPGADMDTYVNRLANESMTKIELIGAMGPPSWDAFGTRNDPGSVWCVNTVGAYQPDQLRYDPDTSTLQPSDTTLEGSDIKCFTFPAQ
jgi:hypothetical protein